MTAKTPIYQLEYIVQGEPIRNARLALENNAKSIEAALAARGVPPTDLQSLIAAGWFTDSGWLTLPIASGFTGNGVPQYRKKANVLYLRNGYTNAGMAASSAYTVGTLPVGFRPSGQYNGVAGSSNGSVVARLIVNSDGTIQLVTGSTLGAYYRLDPAVIAL